MAKMSTFDWFAFLLVFVGALNWGSVGAFDFNFVAVMLSVLPPMVTKIVYVLVGLAGLFTGYRAFTK